MSRYVYMVSFDRSEFVMGGVLYEQTAQLDNVGAVFFSFYTCYTEASSMPLLTFTSAPGVRTFRVEEVTIVDYGNCARHYSDLLSTLSTTSFF